VRYRASEPDKRLYDEILPFEVELADAEVAGTPGGWSACKILDVAILSLKLFSLEKS
jgi:hypothetical protein